MLRDLLLGQVPAVLRRNREVYAEPVILGAVMVAVLLQFHLVNPVTGMAAAFVALVLRLLTLRYGWRLAGRRIVARPACVGLATCN
jgi:uncharacterized membrane protein YeiH